VHVFRRGTDWDRPLIVTEGEVEFVSVGLKMSLDEIYDGLR
jgi:hypothetical protein